MTMLEKVARAMFEACEEETHRIFPGRLRRVTWEERKKEVLSDPRHGDLYTGARAALTAMLEPTEEMKDTSECNYHDNCYTCGGHLEGYQLMIGRALK